MSTPRSKRPSPQIATAADPNAETGGLTFDVGNSERSEKIVVESSAKPASVEIEASALMPGIECPFTDGCAEAGGKVRIHSDVTSTVTDELGRKVPLRQQQFRCNRCNVIAKGTKVINGGQASGQRLFNRVTGKGE